MKKNELINEDGRINADKALSLVKSSLETMSNEDFRNMVCTPAEVRTNQQKSKAKTKLPK